VLARGLATVVAGAALSLGGTAAIPAQTDPVADAQQAVVDAEAEADRAADQYFEQLNRFEALKVEMAGTERRLDELEDRADRLRVQVRARALHAYMRSGDHQLDFGFAGADQAFAAARRTELLEQLNESDNDAAAELARVTSSLESERAQLESERAAQEDVLAQLKAEQETLDAKLAQAQIRRRSVAAAPAPGAAPGTPPAVASEATAAPTPPPDYTRTEGEHPQHNDPFMVCTRARESGGNYQAYNGAGPYLGAYQFLQSTWNSAANHAGRGELMGVDPRNASQYDQDDMAWTLYTWQGKAPWGGGC